MSRLHYFIRTLVLCAVLIFHVKNSGAQVLSFDSYMSSVVREHPAAEQADLLGDIASAEWLASKGAFDPTAFAEAKAKRFSGTDYYRMAEAGVSYVSPFALQLRAGQQRAEGSYLNPMETVPEDGQFFTEITLPLGRGLLTDESRTARRIARLGMDAADAERAIWLNDLLAQAGKQYWNWVYARGQQDIYEEVLRLAGERYEAVRFNFQQGSIPAMDTLEAAIQLQNRRIQLDRARLARHIEEGMLRLYLWGDDGPRNELNWSPPAVDSLLDAAAAAARRTSPNAQPPLLDKIKIEKGMLELEERLKKEYLKPKVNLSFALLGESWRLVGSEAGTEFTSAVRDHHLWKVSFGFPLFLREARGELKKVKFKQEQVELKIIQTDAEIKNLIQLSDRQIDTNRELLLGQMQITADLRSLWSLERERFALGKGSLFMVNAWETQWIEGELQKLKLFSELEKARIERDRAAGILLNRYLE